MTIRTRFAPSPTGWLHLGGARTALFNFLFARHEGGQFLLRVEDTDRERSKPEFLADIEEELRWLGLNWDDSITYQSQRTEIYRTAIAKLLAEGKAYYCFCSKEALEERRQAQMLRGEAPRYDGACRNLTPAEAERRRAAGQACVIRLKVEPHTITFNDLIRGEISWESALIGDFVIAKSQSEPIFHLATPLDDHEQGITHVIRGEEHISNTPKQILVLRALHYGPPHYAHLPVILGEEGGKLSKRHGAKSLRDYRQEGFLPEALLNFSVLLGWHPREDREKITLNEMIAEFSLERVQKKGAAFNLSKLLWLNKSYLRSLSPGDLINDLSFEAFGQFSGDNFQADNGCYFSRTQLAQIIELGRERAETSVEILKNVSFFFTKPTYDWSLLVWKDHTSAEMRQSLEQVKVALSNLPESDFSSAKIMEVLNELGSEKGLVFWPLRVALTGLKASPAPNDIAAILGKSRTIDLLDQAIMKLTHA